MPRWESVIVATHPVSGLVDARQPLSGNLAEHDAASHVDIMRKNIRRAAEALVGAVRESKSFVASQRGNKRLAAEHQRFLIDLALMIDRELQS